MQTCSPNPVSELRNKKKNRTAAGSFLFCHDSVLSHHNSIAVPASRLFKSSSVRVRSTGSFSNPSDSDTESDTFPFTKDWPAIRDYIGLPGHGL